MKHIEDGIQRGFFDWVRLAEKIDERLKLMHHVPNGGKRDAREAGRLKAAGVRPGVPDVMLPVASGAFIGLAIEFKAPKNGVITVYQAKFLDLLAKQNWKVVVCTDIQSAIDAVKEYLI